MSVKLSSRSTARTRIFLLLTSLAVLSVFLLTYSLKSSVSVAESSKANEQAGPIAQDDGVPNTPHWLVGSYYSTQNAAEPFVPG